MKKILKDFYYGFGSSFTNDPNGASSKKIVAYAISFCVIMVHIKWWRHNDFTLLPTILGMDFSFILTLFGINVYDKMKNQTDTKTTLNQEDTDTSSKTTLTKETIAK